MLALREAREVAREESKDFNAMLHRDAGMPKIQIITDPVAIQKYGGEKCTLPRLLIMTGSCDPCRGAGC